MFWKLGVSGALIAFFSIGFFLATGHSGFAIKMANYVYLLLLISIILGLKMRGKNERP